MGLHVFQYACSVAVLVGDSALQLCITVERLIFGDCDDIVVRAFILVHIVCYLCLHSLLIYV